MVVTISLIIPSFRRPVILSSVHSDNGAVVAPADRVGLHSCVCVRTSPALDLSSEEHCFDDEIDVRWLIKRCSM